MRRRPTLAVVLLFAAALAHARAGGGGGYHGGGYSGGGHGGGGYSGGSYGGGSGGYPGGYPTSGGDYRSSSSQGDGSLVVMMFMLAFLLLLVKVLNGGATRITSIDARGMSNALDAELQNRRREALSLIRGRDPGFDEHAFLQRAAGAFLAVQDAWSRMDMSKARAFISDGVHERFSRQIADYAARNIRNRMTDVAVLETEALGYLAGPHYDAVYVRLKASALDQIVALDSETVLAGGPDEFEEVWTFLRRPGVKTVHRAGLLEGHCPSCGAPLSIADAAQCAACKAWVNSGEHDWVLVSITQTCEWAFPNPEREITGWEELREDDPGLSLEALEDRAAMTFWRWLDARRRQDPAPLRGVAADAYLKRFVLDGSSERDAAVGSVEVIAFEPGADLDRVHLEVRWEADLMKNGSGGKSEKLGRDRRTHFLVFERKSGATSDLKAGLRAARCPSCGAPPEQADAASCAYCGHRYNDGSVSWILADVVPFGLWRRPVVDPSAPVALTGLEWGEDLPPIEALTVLAVGLAADGTMDDRERAYLMAYADKRGVDEGRAEALLHAALEKRLDVPRPKDAPEAEAMLRGLIRMTLADGVIVDTERALLSSFGRALGLHEREIGMMIKEERLALHARAAAALAERRGGS